MKISFNNSPKIELNPNFHDLAKNAKGGKNNIKFNLWSPISTCLTLKHH